VQRKEGNTSILEIYANSIFPVFEVPIASVSSIQFNGMDGADSLIVNSSEGEIRLANGVHFDGGDGTDDVSFIGGTKLTKTEQVTAGVTRTEIDAVEFRQTQITFHENVETVTDQLVQADFLQSLGAGIEKLLESMDLLANPDQSISAELAVLGTSLPRA
jgi:hypothetical protein